MGYTPLRINTITPDKVLPFDLYIFYREVYLKYKDNGISLDQVLLQKLKEQKIARFFITDNEEPKYQKYLDEILNNLADNQDISIENKAEITEGVTSNAVEKMQRDPTSKASFNVVKTAAKNLRDVVTKNPDALKLIFSKKAGENEKIIKHSLNVCMLVIKMAEAENIVEDALDNLIVAALLHDLGITQLSANDQKLFEKPRKDFSVDELRTYNSHPQLSTDLLKDKKYVNVEILDHIFFYSENLTGKGPQKKTNLTKEDEILSMINCYDKKIICQNMSPKDAIKDFQINELGNYNLELINT
ncbi:MAG: HD domain-containing protein, partial [Bacteriovoracaceae bacterium]|nr:HD domain-containing protein [Bacteriovoracaceae bacterium]